MISQFERDILTQVDGRPRVKPTEMGYPTVAWIVWYGRDDAIEFGRVRWGHAACDYLAQEARWSASPFPGAWVNVPESRIIRVRHPEAMN